MATGAVSFVAKWNFTGVAPGVSATASLAQIQRERLRKLYDLGFVPNTLWQTVSDLIAEEAEAIYDERVKNHIPIDVTARYKSARGNYVYTKGEYWQRWGRYGKKPKRTKRGTRAKTMAEGGGRVTGLFTGFLRDTLHQKDRINSSKGYKGLRTHTTSRAIKNNAATWSFYSFYFLDAPGGIPYPDKLFRDAGLDPLGSLTISLTRPGLRIRASTRSTIYNLIWKELEDMVATALGQVKIRRPAGV